MNESASTPLTHIVGIDVAKLKLDIALLVNDGKDKLKSKVFDNTPGGFAELQDWLTARGATTDSTHLCMEATGPYSESAATALAEAGWKVSVVNPARVKGYAQSELARNKTDQADAALLARFCANLRPALWTPPCAAWRELRGWVDRLQALKDIRQQEANRVEAHQASGQPALVQAVQTHLNWLDKEIAQREQAINDHIDHHPELKQDAQLLQTIPGIGSTTIAKVLAYAGDVRRFDSAKALAAFIGVSPRLRLSGTSVKGRTMMSRSGHGALRKALYMPGLVARRHNPALKAFGDRLKANGLAPKAVIGAIMRKLAHLIYGVITSGKPFDLHKALPRLDFQDGI